MPRVCPRPFVALISVVLAGCQAPQPTLDASSTEAFANTLSQVVAGAPEEIRSKVEQAAADLRTAYLAPVAGSPDAAPAAPVPLSALDGYAAEDVLRLHARYLDTGGWPDVAPAFDHSLRQRLIALYRMDADSLAARREKVEKKLLVSPNRLPILDFVMLPPSSKAAIEDDKARFVLKIRNDGIFPVYFPSFRVKIASPGALVPAFDRTFAMEELKPPIEPGATRELSWSCCAILSDPVANRAIKELPDGARLEVSITSAKDFAKQELLEIDTYPLADARREQHLRTCLDRLQRTNAEDLVTLGRCLSPSPPDHEEEEEGGEGSRG